MSERSVIVVGAGMVGLSTAWSLQRHGFQVTVVERYDVGAGASWGNAGWLSPALTLPLPEPAILAPGVRALIKADSPIYVPLTANLRLVRFLTGFARHCTDNHWRTAMRVFAHANTLALDAYEQMVSSTDGPVAAPIRNSTPHVAAFTSESDRKALVDELEHAGAIGALADYRLLDSHAVRAAAPILTDKAQFGLAIEGQRFINPGDFLYAIADAVKAGGGEILTGREVTSIDDRGLHSVVRLSDGQELRADTTVIATGAWLGKLARPLGIRRLVQAGRGYSFTVYPEVTPTSPLYLPAQRVACTPLGGHGDGLRLAGMMEFRAPDAPLDERRVCAIVNAAAPLLDGVDWSARTDEWVGSRPCTVDGLPLVGRTKNPKVFVAGGHGMWGIALGPLTGRLLADEIAGVGTDPLLKAFDPLR